MTVYQFPVPKVHTTFICDRSRNSGLTSVRWVALNRVVCADFAGRMLYHVRLEPDGQMTILGQCPTRDAEGEPVETDLIDVAPNGVDLVLSHFRKGAQGHYRLKGDDVVFIQEVNRKSLKQNHGVRWVPRRASVLAAYCHADNPCVEYVDIEGAGGSRVRWRVDTPALAQDMAILRNYLLVPMRTPHITPEWKTRRVAVEKMQATMALYEWDVLLPTHAPRYLGHWTGPGHLDAAVTYDSGVWVTNQYYDSVDVFAVTGRGRHARIERVGEVTGFDFPHGIDINYGQMAVTNYGSNTLHVLSMDEVEVRPTKRGKWSRV